MKKFCKSLSTLKTVCNKENNPGENSSIIYTGTTGSIQWKIKPEAKITAGYKKAVRSDGRQLEVKSEDKDIYRRVRHCLWRDSILAKSRMRRDKTREEPAGRNGNRGNSKYQEHGPRKSHLYEQRRLHDA